jgi:hypothetical protein
MGPHGPWGFPLSNAPTGPTLTSSSSGEWDADPMTQPLPLAPPATWTGREDRVRWCLENLTEGEQARLYQSLNRRGLKFDACDAIVAKERKACA